MSTLKLATLSYIDLHAMNIPTIARRLGGPRPGDRLWNMTESHCDIFMERSPPDRQHACLAPVRAFGWLTHGGSCLIQETCHTSHICHTCHTCSADTARRRKTSRFIWLLCGTVQVEANVWDGVTCKIFFWEGYLCWVFIFMPILTVDWRDIE